jgi:hypothetical protein
LERQHRKNPPLGGFFIQLNQLTLARRFQSDRFDLRSITRRTKRFITCDTHITHRRHVAPKNLRGSNSLGLVAIKRRIAPIETKRRSVSSLTHAALGAFDDVFNRYAVGCFDVTARPVKVASQR